MNVSTRRKGSADLQHSLRLPRYEQPTGLHPPLDCAGYHSTELRHPQQDLVLLPQALTEITGPLLGTPSRSPSGPPAPGGWSRCSRRTPP